MTINAGVWIDHHNAIVIHLNDQNAQIQNFTSNQGAAADLPETERVKNSYTRNDFQPEDKRDRKEMIHFNEFYDEVIAVLHNADSVLVFGPGEAKGEFAKRMETQKSQKRIAEVKTTDKMTDPQITSYVREFFKTRK